MKNNQTIFKLVDKKVHTHRKYSINEFLQTERIIKW